MLRDLAQVQLLKTTWNQRSRKSGLTWPPKKKRVGVSKLVLSRLFCLGMWHLSPIPQQVQVEQALLPDISGFCPLHSQQLVQNTMISCLKRCDTLVTGLPPSILLPLLFVPCRAVIAISWGTNFVTPMLSSLQTLSVAPEIKWKLPIL